MSRTLLCAALACLALCAVGAQGQLMNSPFSFFDSGSPPDPFGIDGFDVNSAQSVAVRFVSNIDATLSSLELWMMSNVGVGSDVDAPTVDVLIVQGNDTTPSTAVVEAFKGVPVTVQGWNPTQIVLNPTAKPELAGGATYWIVMSSTAEAPNDPLWCLSNTVAFSTTSSAGVWQAGGFSMTAAVKVVGDNTSGPVGARRLQRPKKALITHGADL